MLEGHVLIEPGLRRFVQCQQPSRSPPSRHLVAFPHMCKSLPRYSFPPLHSEKSEECGFWFTDSSASCGAREGIYLLHLCLARHLVCPLVRLRNDKSRLGDQLPNLGRVEPRRLRHVNTHVLAGFPRQLARVAWSGWRSCVLSSFPFLSSFPPPLLQTCPGKTGCHSVRLSPILDCVFSMQILDTYASVAT